MGNAPPPSFKKATFEEVAENKGVLINVMADTEQGLLIRGTCSLSEEVDLVERAITEKRPIVVYGKNSHDDRIYAKYKQLVDLGGDPRVYIGGLFEWLLLQDVYGFEKFPTTRRELDIYKFRPS
jgi:hypothetical protein